MGKPSSAATRPTGRQRRWIQQFRVTVTAGPSKGKVWKEKRETCAIGSHPSNDLVIDDPTVSRFHSELSIATGAVRVRDLGSRNGTFVGDVSVTEGRVSGGTHLTLGESTVRIDVATEHTKLEASDRSAFGSIIGESSIMRELFAQLEKVAASDATVLIEGETGTGKEGVADAIHDASGRSKGPLVVVDCSAIPANLLESELFGHEAGAFTGATHRRVGAFEQASGGILFLDEIGELPLELQPKFLRALESREIRRVGSHAPIQCDLRILAATNRDLRTEVNRGTFRADLYYRLAVVKVALPPLRERASDIPLLVKYFLEKSGANATTAAAMTRPEFLAALAAAPWPGNVRELRNHIEQCVVFGECRLPNTPTSARPTGQIDLAASYEIARRQALDQFEQTYLTSLLERHDGNVAAAARAANVNRAYLYRMLGRHGLR